MMDNLLRYLQSPDVEINGVVTLTPKQVAEGIREIKEARGEAETQARFMMAEKDREIAGLVEELTRERKASARIAEALAHLVLKE